MPINFYAASRIDTLFDKLYERTHQIDKSVFETLDIVTQTKGIEQWITFQYADRKGVAANIKFLKPNDIIFKVYAALDGPSQVTFEAHYLTWLIYEILSEKQFLLRFPQQAQYLLDDGSADYEMKRYKFAGQLADLFDQYQIYRQDILEEWIHIPLPLHRDWQGYIWKAIAEKTAVINANPYTDHWSDKNELAAVITEGLKHPEKVAQLKAVVKDIHIFGLSVFTDYHLQLFYKIAEHIDVNFYILNPASEVFWDDTLHSKVLAKLRLSNDGELPELAEQGNDLLLGWGSLLKSMLKLFFKNDQIINAYEILDEQITYPNTLLGTIQSEIASNLNLEQRATIDIALLTDGSIVIQNNYAPLREVESLYQYLLHLVEKGELTDTRKVLVMLTDVDLYAPYIHAVFDHKKFSFRYKIADEKPTASFDLLSALSYLLHLNYSKITANDVVELLSYAAIRQLFQIEDIELVKSLLLAANIRYGLTNQTDDDTYLVSWKYGLQRMVYGICMSGEPIITVDDKELIPIDVIEGNQTTILLNVVGLVDFIFDYLKHTHEKRTILSWLDLFEEKILSAVSVMYADDNEQYILLTQQIDFYRKAAIVSQVKVTYDVFVADFEHNLNVNENNGSKYLSGGITFCSLIPMRSIPFDTIAVLGLNQNVFPRKEDRLSYDMMLLAPRPGDRNVRASDKYLMLDMLFAAQKSLYLSYVGSSINDNSLMPPSVIIDELLFYIQQKTTEDVGKVLVTRQPLHRFSTLYNKADQRLYYYDDQSNPISIPEKIHTEAEIVTVPDTISLDALSRKMLSPTKNYIQQAYQISFYDDDTIIPDEEAFDFDAYEYENRVAALVFHTGAERAEWFKRSYLKGEWPLKSMSQILYQQVEEKIDEIHTFFEAKGINITEARTETVAYPVGDQLIEGKVSGIVGDNLLLLIGVKEVSIRNVFELMLKGLILKQMGIVNQGYIIAINGAITQYDFTPFTDETITAWLYEVVKWYQIAHESLVLFHHKFNDDFQPNQIASMLKSILSNMMTTPQPALELMEAKWNDEEVITRSYEYYTAIFTLVKQLKSSGSIGTI